METLIKYLTTRYLLWSRRYQDAPLLDFRSVTARTRRFLIHVPPSFSPTQLSPFLKQLRTLFPESTLDFLIAPDCPESLKRILAAQSAMVHMITPEDLRFFRILRRPVVEKLKERNFDIVIDLSASFDVTYAHAIRSCGAPIVIGSYGSDQPQIFHNLFVKASNPSLYSDNVCRCLAQLKT